MESFTTLQRLVVCAMESLVSSAALTHFGNGIIPYPATHCGLRNGVIGRKCRADPFWQWNHSASCNALWSGQWRRCSVGWSQPEDEPARVPLPCDVSGEACAPPKTSPVGPRLLTPGAFRRCDQQTGHGLTGQRARFGSWLHGPGCNVPWVFGQTLRRRAALRFRPRR